MRRRSGLLALAAALSLTLAACGSGGGDEGGGSGETSGDSGSFEGKTLTVWIMEGTNPDAQPFFDDVSAAFQKETGADLDVQFVPWASAHDKFLTSIAGNTTPDVAEVGTTWTPEFAEAGALADLTDRVKSSDAADDLVEGLVEAGTVDGKLYGMPWYAGVRSILYRTDVFDELGLKPPTTWDELVQVGEAIKTGKPDMTPMPIAGDNEYGVYPFIWGAGGEIATKEGDKWVAKIDSADSQKGVAFYTGLATEHRLSTPAAQTWKETDLRDAFATGKAAMVISGSWTPKAILESNPELDGKIGAFPIPGPDGDLSPSFLGGSHLAIFEASDQQDLAWKFIELMSDDEFAQKWATESSFFPGRQSLLQEAIKSGDPLVAPFAKQMVEAGRSVPVTPAYGAVQAKKTVPAMVQSILSGNKSVEQATSDAAAEINEVLNS